MLLAVFFALSRNVCRFKVRSPESSPFYVELLDQKYGFAELRVDPKVSSNITKMSSFILEIEASDCDEHYRTTSRFVYDIF
ncbi:uncharacterized protein DC041_0001349 [Schistosoma bovis]|uniref:Uncharacterized protein n=1 Tax=Schistosoma bovis TaxID=6184 RepID=A0A430QJC7_SCHBO|nr:uncharacterized protein DC041_0001349 [Schistosoma bovis]